MAFNKNMVLTEHAFTINVKADADEEAPMLSCPRCGHVQERKLRTMCLGCKRFIPYDEARQKWERKPYKNPYIDLTDLVEEQAEAKEVNFKRMRKGYWEYVRSARSIMILAAFLAAVYVGTPYAGKAIFGPAKFGKIERQFQQACKDAQNSGKKLASAVAHRM